MYVINIKNPEEIMSYIHNCIRKVYPSKEDPVVVFDGLTKGFRYPGWRAAWMVGPKYLRKLCKMLDSSQWPLET